jgi:hypothetical protein
VDFANTYVVGLLIALAFLFFLIGIVRYFFSENDENRAKGRQFALWGIVGLAVIFSLWGIVNVFLAVIQ